MQTAAEIYKIPKTVLWRRMNKEGYRVLRPDIRVYNSDKREAAVKALERGENLSKVSQEYQVKCLIFLCVLLYCLRFF